MESRVRWVGSDGMSFVAETGSGHAFVMDGAPEGGGHNLGPRPMETVLAGTGGCTAYDVVVILKKSGQDITGCEVRLSSERAPTDLPKEAVVGRRLPSRPARSPPSVRRSRVRRRTRSARAACRRAR